MPLIHAQSKRRLFLVACFAWIPICHSQGQDQDQVRHALVARMSGRPSLPTEQLVEQLGHDQYRTRESAARELIRRATHGDDAERAQITEQLEQGKQAESLETRAASQRILKEIELADRDTQLKRLMNPRCQSETIDISGWQLFCGIAGDDMDARSFFARLAQRHPRTLDQLQKFSESPPTESPLGKLDPWRLSAEDSASWALLLLAESGRSKQKSLPFNSRLSTALSCSPMGPTVSGCSESRVLRRLIAHWLQIHEQRHAQRDRLLIAMRYGCRKEAAEICGRILDDQASTPATEVTALLAAAALQRNDLELQTRSRLHDSRTAHVWQQVTSRKVKIRTQVRDVALALLMFHHGLDPRQAGYRDLQADPSFLYRDHSLGFPDPESRLASQKEAANLLATVGAAEFVSAQFGRRPDSQTARSHSSAGDELPIELPRPEQLER